jgi:hypothetical protein
MARRCCNLATQTTKISAATFSTKPRYRRTIGSLI